jgi:serine/threonine protein kinase/Tfp pilus assembly protein PilF
MKRADPAMPPVPAPEPSAADLQAPAERVRRLLREGQPVDVQTLLAAEPQLQADKSLLLDLAYEEYCQRREAGQQVDADEFCRRFPYQSSLRRLLGVHHFLEENPQLLAESKQVAWPAPPEQFLGFTLIRELGRGSFARVFLATEPALGGRSVAIKVSRLGAVEAHLLGRLDHPNIVPVHSVQHDAASGFTVICMPYLGSATLCDLLDRVASEPSLPESARIIKDVIAAGPEPAAARAYRGTYVDAAVQIGSQLAEALALAHSLGICHRDLKPSNVLLAGDGRPMLLDFNLASDQQLADSHLGGTLPYMAPEQLRATDPATAVVDAPPVDARADIFSLGVMLYELLAGVHPFAPLLVGSLAEARSRLLEGQRRGPASLRQRNPCVDRPLARLVERCLAFAPEDRPQSARELAAALRAGLSWRRRATRWLGRHRVLATTAGLLLTALVVLGSCALAMRDPYAVRQYRAGIACYRQGNYREALAHLNSSLAEEPRSSATLFARARVFQQLGDFNLAFKDYEAAAGLDQDGPTWAATAYCLCRLEAYEQAAYHFERAVDTGFGPAAVWNDLGWCYLRLGELDKAKAALDRAVALDAGLQAAFHNRAMVCLQKSLSGGELGEGLGDIRRALEIGPATADLHRHAAHIYASTGFTDLALEHLRRAVEQGEDPQSLRDDFAFRALRADPWFAEMVRKPRTQITRSRSVRLVDPIQD